MNWKNYNRDYQQLVTLIHEATTNSNIKIRLLLKDGSIYDCYIKHSNCFKGLSYYEGVNIETNSIKNIAIGDDIIKSWDYVNKDLLAA